MNLSRALHDAAVSLEQWLDARTATAPESLRPRLSAAVRGTGSTSDQSPAELSCRAGESLLKRLLVEDCAARSAAPDLLAADALVTYAFEAAAESDGASAADIDAMAARAMARIAALGSGAP